MTKALIVLLSVFSFSTFAEYKKLVIIGDSLTEGYGVSREMAFPSLLQKKIDAANKKWQVVNSGISGSTSASAVNRVKWHLKQKPSLILLALGANDGLRGLPVKELEKNLSEAVDLAQKNSIKIILAGMRMPPNYGEPYASNYAAAFRNVAQKKNIKLIPFLLEKVAGVKTMNLEDGIHPNAKGHEIIANTVFEGLRKEL